MKKVKILSGLVFLVTSSVTFAQCDLSNATGAWDIVNQAVSENDATPSLDVTAAAAMASTSCGLEVTTIVSNSGATGADSDKPYVLDDSPNGETRFRAAFYIDANNLDLPAAGTQFRKAKFHVAQCASGECEGGNVTVWRVVNRAAAGDPVDVGIEFWVRDDNLPDVSGWDGRIKKRQFAFDIPDSGPQRIEYDLNIAGGSMRVWLNAPDEATNEITLPVEFSNLDLTPWAAGIKRARLGFIERRSGITEGQSFYLDEYESRRQTFIGM